MDVIFFVDAPSVSGIGKIEQLTQIEPSGLMRQKTSPFSGDEIDDLREMLREWRQDKQIWRKVLSDVNEQLDKGRD